MNFILDKRTFDILFKEAPVDDVTIPEIVEAEKDLNNLQKALASVKKKLLKILNERAKDD